MWKRMGRVDGQRSKRRKDVSYEVLAQDFPLLLVQFGDVPDMNAGLVKFGQQIVLPTRLMSLEMHSQLTANGQHLFRRRHGVGRSLTSASRDLAAEARDSDHKEFVQIRREDRQELDPLQKRISGVFSFLQHTEVELQPTEFAGQE